MIAAVRMQAFVEKKHALEYSSAVIIWRERLYQSKNSNNTPKNGNNEGNPKNLSVDTARAPTAGSPVKSPQRQQRAVPEVFIGLWVGVGVRVGVQVEGLSWCVFFRAHAARDA